MFFSNYNHQTFWINEHSMWELSFNLWSNVQWSIEFLNSIPRVKCDASLKFRFDFFNKVHNIVRFYALEMKLFFLSSTTLAEWEGKGLEKSCKFLWGDVMDLFPLSFTPSMDIVLLSMRCWISFINLDDGIGKRLCGQRKVIKACRGIYRFDGRNLKHIIIHQYKYYTMQIF